MNRYTAPLASLVLCLTGAALLLSAGLVPLDGSGKLSVCIVEETADRTRLAPGQLAVLDGLAFRQAIADAGGTFVGCIDKDLLGPDKKPPAALAPWVEAAKGYSPPVLLVSRGGKIRAYAITTEAAACKAAGVK